MNDRYRPLTALHVVTLLGLALAAISHAAEVPDPGAWYMDEYAPLWRDLDDSTAASVTAFYLPSVQVHLESGAVINADPGPWLADMIATWRAEGWVGSDLSDLKIERIKPTTAAFTTRWFDRYADGSEEYSCGWYLADFADGQWMFSAYADQVCPKIDTKQ